MCAAICFALLATAIGILTILVEILRTLRSWTAPDNETGPPAMNDDNKVRKDL